MRKFLGIESILIFIVIIICILSFLLGYNESNSSNRNAVISSMGDTILSHLTKNNSKIYNGKYDFKYENVETSIIDTVKTIELKEYYKELLYPDRKNIPQDDSITIYLTKTQNDKVWFFKLKRWKYIINNKENEIAYYVVRNKYTFVNPLIDDIGEAEEIFLINNNGSIIGNFSYDDIKNASSIAASLKARFSKYEVAMLLSEL
jgi:hypothetical protein